MAALPPVLCAEAQRRKKMYYHYFVVDSLMKSRYSLAAHTGGNAYRSLKISTQQSAISRRKP
jgi:hypothetical protein